MKTIDLECPGCAETLELDRGFAGGVCRCSSCGTLMTVPEQPTMRAERLDRPEAPAAPSSRRAERPEAPTRGARPERPGVSKSTSPEDEERASGPQVYRTPSGRTVRIDDLDRVPMAPAKRHAVRAATAVGFFALIGGVLLLCGYAAYVMLSAPTAETRAEAGYVETFAFDRDANPYTLAAPNLFGLPLHRRVAVVYDTTGLSADQLAAVNALLLDGLTRDAEAVRVSVVVNEPDARFWSLLAGDPLGGTAKDTLRTQLDALKPDSAPSSMLGAVEQALTDEPGVLIVVTGRDLSGTESKALQGMVGTDGPRLDAVMIDADSFDLDGAARATNGHYLTLDSDDELARWAPQ